LKKVFAPVRFDKKMTEAEKHFLVFFFGGIGYGLIEIVWRGRTHPSMVITGGACLVLMRLINRKFRTFSILGKSLMCTASITAIEFGVGCIVNIWLGLGVWDYSDMKMNILGQVCLLYCGLWFCICVPIVTVMSMMIKKNSSAADNNTVKAKKRQKPLSFLKKV